MEVFWNRLVELYLLPWLRASQWSWPCPQLKVVTRFWSILR